MNYWNCTSQPIQFSIESIQISTKHSIYSCLWKYTALKLCFAIAEGWSYLYFLSTMNLEMWFVVINTGLRFCAARFIRPPWGSFDATFWVLYCPWHFRTCISWCRMKGRCFKITFPFTGFRELCSCYHLAKIFLVFLHILSGEVISRLYARSN